MSVQTYMQTDWIEVHNHDKSYLAKVFLTPDDECYMVVVQKGVKFYKVDGKLLRLGEIGFFERVMDDGEELPVEKVIEIGIIAESEIEDIINTFSSKHRM